MLENGRLYYGLQESLPWEDWIETCWCLQVRLRTEYCMFVIFDSTQVSWSQYLLSVQY